MKPRGGLKVPFRLSCHAGLDHVMALIAETEQVRTGARAAQAGRKRTEALDTAAAAIAPAVQTVEEAVATLGHRGKQARSQGLATLRELQETLDTVSQRLRRTQPA